MKALIWIVSLGALGVALAIGLAGPGVRLGLWDYATGLQILRDAALPAMIGAGASLVALVIALVGARAVAPVPLVAAVLAGLAAMIPVQMRAAFEANPFIHDITTDFDDPPAITLGADKPRVNPVAYLGDELTPQSSQTVSEAQRASFPDIRPVMVDMPVDNAASLALAVVKDMNMKLLSDGPVDDGWVIEATYTSFWFRFVDDFIVRIRPDGEGARIDIRSKSRVGASDLGANGKRALEFIEKFNRRAARTAD